MSVTCGSLLSLCSKANRDRPLEAGLDQVGECTPGNGRECPVITIGRQMQVTHAAIRKCVEEPASEVLVRFWRAKKEGDAASFQIPPGLKKGLADLCGLLVFVVVANEASEWAKCLMRNQGKHSTGCGPCKTRPSRVEEQSGQGQKARRPLAVRREESPGSKGQGGR